MTESLQNLNGSGEVKCSHPGVEFVVNGAGDLLRVECPDCGGSWRCETWV